MIRELKVLKKVAIDYLYLILCYFFFLYYSLKK